MSQTTVFILSVEQVEALTKFVSKIDYETVRAVAESNCEAYRIATALNVIYDVLSDKEQIN